MCDKKIKSKSIVLEKGKRLIINIPTPRILKNMSDYSLILCQKIPCDATTEQVVICWANGRIINLIGVKGNHVRADQLKCRTCYPIVFGTDPLHYSMLRLLPCSGHIYSVATILEAIPIVSYRADVVAEENEQQQ